MEPHSAPLAVSIADAARSIGLSKRSVEHLISRGELPSRKVGRRRLVLYRDLQRLIGHDVAAITPRQSSDSAA